MRIKVEHLSKPWVSVNVSEKDEKVEIHNAHFVRIEIGGIEYRIKEYRTRDGSGIRLGISATDGSLLLEPGASNLVYIETR